VVSKGRPELELLLAIASLGPDSPSYSQLHEHLSHPLDWEHLHALAAWHGMAPLLFHHLTQSQTSQSQAQPPAEAMQALREECRQIAQRNLILAAKLQWVCAHLRSRGLAHIVFKGPLLAERLYGNCALRVSHDLDLLVPEDRLEAVRDALAELGFSDKYGLTPAQQAASFRFGFEHPFAAAGGLDLDLHWRIVPRFIAPSLEMAGLWRRLRMAPLFGSQLPTFAPEDELVALCLHAGQHEWVQISHFCDLAQLLARYPQLDWQLVRSHLGDPHTRRTVFVCLHLLRQHWQLPLPAEMLQAMASDAHAALLARRVATSLWPMPGLMPLQSDLGWLRTRTAGEPFGVRARVMLGIVLGPTLDDFAALRLPRPLAPLYPLLRALRLARKYATRRKG
jgi:hypothetical protein